jgi:hypothetical protein
VQLVNNVPNSLPHVLGDTGRSIQIFYNLIGNSCKFTHQGYIAVTACQQGDMVEVRVSDTGIGIPEKNLKSVFNEFEQVDMSTTRKYGGTGLGLNLVQQLVKAHNGTITLTSELEKGTIFTFTLPVSAPLAARCWGAVLVARCWGCGAGGAVLGVRCCWRGAGGAVLRVRCWRAGAGGAVLWVRCWQVGAAGAVLAGRCCGCGAGGAALGVRCWQVGAAGAVLVARWGCGAGGAVLGVRCWWRGAGGAALVAQCWGCGAGGLELWARCWRCGAGGVVLAVRCWWCGAGGAGSAGGGGGCELMRHLMVFAAWCWCGWGRC